MSELELIENEIKSSVDFENNIIEVASCSVDELFSENIPGTTIVGKLVIPEYQRPYVWGEKQINTLLNDLNDYFENNTSSKSWYYLGSIILHKSNNQLNIIDGQQRITTLAIIQSILQENKVPSINYASPLTIENIKQNHKLLSDRLTVDSMIDFKRINFTLVVTSNEDDAYTFFETQNTGGVRLSGSDILKAHHLRAIKEEFKRSDLALKWESQKKVDEVINYLLKARKWNILEFKDVPSYRNLKETKNNLVAEFSERTSSAEHNPAFQMIEVLSDGQRVSFNIPSHIYSVRQPLNNGINFILYFTSFCKIYEDLFIDRKAFIHNEFYKFRDDIIRAVDGTAYLKEFFEISLIIYVSRYGLSKLYEAALWIFRYTYSLRVSNQKTVREDSIPAFIKSNNYIFDKILMSFTHEELIESLKQFSYSVNENNLEGNTVKARFVNRTNSYFSLNLNGGKIIDIYDSCLKQSITAKVKNNG